MQWQHREPPYSQVEAPSVVVLEAEPGPRRDAAVESWLRQARDTGAHTWWLPCQPEIGGIWAGLAELIQSLLPQIERAAPDILAAHGYEISLVLPEYRGQLDVPRPLTDTASPDERTRNYPADRAYRSLHGLIELLSEWHDRCGAGSWAMACNDYDLANGLIWRFFRELARRRGRQLGLQLLVVAGPGRGDDVAAGFSARVVTGGFRPDWPTQPAAVPADPGEMTARAVALEALLESGAMSEEIALPRLIRLWQQSSHPERALPWQVKAFSVFNHYGLYEASLVHADAVEANLDKIRALDRHKYFVAVHGLFFCWVPLNHAEKARRTLESALEHLDRAALSRALYLVAMLYARFLQPKDLQRAEECLQRALDLLAEPGPAEDEDDRQFLMVFLMNGLALIRVRQQRTAEALALCQAGLDRLRQHLAPTQHRLHRSVLLYNIAQVYAQIGPYEKALEYFGQSMEMDPNYSEYYNDRGAVYYKMGRVEEAEHDYLAAIGLSPPYAEVWINLGQCYRAQGRMADAVSAYSRAIDLDPESSLAWAGRADAHGVLGGVDQSLEDYHHALRLDPSQPLVWGARAVAYYEKGQVAEALADLDRAIALAPDLGELRQNRAVALRELGRTAEAAGDLRSYLELCPDADDRAEVMGQLESLLLAMAS